MKKILLIVNAILLLTSCSQAPAVPTLVTPTVVSPVATVESVSVTPQAVSTPIAEINDVAWRFPILIFHHIGPIPDVVKNDPIRQGLTVSTATLESHLKMLKDNQFTPITFLDIRDFLDHKKALPAKPIMLHFDDGYEDNFTEALPLLKKYQMPGVFYIITDKVGTPDYMTWDQVEALHAQGSEIGSHTRTHPDLPQTSSNPKRLEEEVVHSLSLLEAHNVGDVISFAYPSGKFNEVVAQLVEKHYQFGRTIKFGEFSSNSRRGEIDGVRIKQETNLAKILHIGNSKS